MLGGAASAAASISTFAHAANPCSTPTTWDKTYDIIVIGSGGAGLSAGIVAKEKGANAVVLEKLSIPGGNTMVSGGGLNAAVEADYKKAGIEDSPQLHTKQTMAAGDYRADPALVATLCENVPQSVEWLKKVGVQFKPGIYQIYGGLWPRCRNPVGQSGGDYIKACMNYANKIGLPVLTNHKVVGIIREKPDSGRVLGVEVELKDGKKEFWKANKAVVAAAGGFAANPTMCSYFDPRLTKLNTTNQPGSTGEVLKCIQGIGGLAVGLDYIQCIPWTAPGYKHTADIFQAIEYTIFLNKEGKRYVAEDARRDVIRDATLAQTDQTVFPVCDTDGFDKNNEYYNEMNHRALENGTLFKADTIEELAKLIKVPPEVMVATINEYNAMVDSKKDPLGRTPIMLSHKIVKAPFYAGPIGMCRHHTMGAPRSIRRLKYLTATEM